MKLLSVDTLTSPELAQVGRFETRSGKIVSVFFRTASPIAMPVRTDHFFLIGALAAYLRGEPYVHTGLVDQRLFENFHDAMRQWSRWWGHREINISAETTHAVQGAAAARTACLFSGGVDSLFTLDQERDEISSLVNLVHCDSEQDHAAAKRLHQDLSTFAEEFGTELIGVETNIMYAFDEVEDAWTSISHGACMAAVGHFLSGEIGGLIISASFAESQLRPWGSHPDTDPLMSSSAMTYRHEGEAYTRFEKHREIARDPLMLRHLSVCERGPQLGEHINCSNCQKCLRSMITLDLLRVDPADAPSFDWSDYAPDKLKRFLLPGHVNCSELLAYARQTRRLEIAAILEDVIAYADKYRWLVQGELFLRRRFKRILKHKTTLKRLRRAVYSVMNIRMRRL